MRTETSPWAAGLLACLVASCVVPSRPAHAERPALPAAELGEVHGNEATVVRLGQRLRCPVCQGMSIGDSPAPMAQDMMRQVRRMREAHRSEEEIVAYFTARYGDWVLLDPPKTGVGLWVWILPPAALLAGVGYALAVARRRSCAAGNRPAPAAARAPATSPSSVPGSNLQAIRHEVHNR